MRVKLDNTGYLYLKDIMVSKSSAPVAAIEHKAMGANGPIKKTTGRFNVEDDIYEATGATRMEAYNGFVVSEIVPDMEGRLGYVRFLSGVKLKRSTVYGDSTGKDMRRIQIRKAIKNHLEKEEALFHRGIKCLSLFFIDEVAKYCDLSDNGELVGYAKVFEEEYAACVGEFLNDTSAMTMRPTCAAYRRMPLTTATSPSARRGMPSNASPRQRRSSKTA